MGCKLHGETLEANNGFLCNNCFSNLRWALQKAPEALQHLREVYVMRPAIQNDGSKPIKRDPPAPFNLDAWQIAEEMFEAIDDRYIPLDWTPLQVYGYAEEKCQYIHQHMERLVNTKEVIFVMPLIKLTRLALHRYPLEEKPRMTLLRCPECSQRTIYQPPAEYGDPLEVKCHNCGFTIPPEKMEFYANMAERENSANL